MSPKKPPFVRTHQYIVRLNVRMQNVGLAQEFQRQEQLLTIRAHRLHMQSHILAILLQYLAQIHAKRLEHHTEVILVEEVPEEA